MIVQFAPAATAAPQLFVWLKLPEVLATLETARGDPPVFASTTAREELLEPTGTLPKLKVLGERAAAAGGAVDEPVPDRLALCEPPPALSVTVSVPLRVPVAAGVNMTLAWQFAPAASVAPQLFVWLKSPLALMLVRARADPPVLDSTTPWEPL